MTEIAKVTADHLHDLHDRPNTVLAVLFTAPDRLDWSVGVLTADAVAATGAHVVTILDGGEQIPYTHDRWRALIADLPTHVLEEWDWERYAAQASRWAIVTASTARATIGF